MRFQTAGSALLAGALIAFSMPPWGWWPLAFVGVALFDRLIANQPRRTRFKRGFVVGAAWLYPATFWMIDLTPPGYVIAGLITSTFYGLAAAALPEGRSRWLGWPAVLVVAAWVRWNFPFGGVPLATLAMSQSAAPLGQTARVLGPLMIVGMVGVAGVALAAAAERQWKAAGAAAAGVLLAIALAAVAPTGQSIGTLDVAIVQGGGEQGTRAINTPVRQVFEAHLEASELVETPVDLVIWPENVVNVEGEFSTNPEFDELALLAQQLDAPIIPGIVEGVDSTTFLNASVVIDADGNLVDRYDKQQRVPFGEYVPFRSIIEPLAPDFLPGRDARAGTEPPVIDTTVGRFAIAISWEIFFSPISRDGVSRDGEVIVNPTNGSSYWLTILQSQQVASSRLRAIENGRWVLQAAPTGFSAIIDPDGNVLERTGTRERRVLHGTIERRGGTTWATAAGDWPMLLLAVAALGAAVGIDRRQPPDSSPA